MCNLLKVEVGGSFYPNLIEETSIHFKVLIKKLQVEIRKSMEQGILAPTERFTKRILDGDEEIFGIPTEEKEKARRESQAVAEKAMERLKAMKLRIPGMSLGKPV